MKRTRAFQAYLYDARAAEKETLGRNRSAMIQQVSDLGVSPDSLILVTHERLTHLNDHCPSAFMHLYGHIHGFAHSNYKGTHFVNVSVLDRLAGMVPDSPVERSDTLCNANAGTYTIIEIGREATTVTSHQLPIDYLGWTKAAFAVIGSPLVPEEATFGFYRAFMTESTEPQ